jgi:hypothetical protein
MKLIHTLRFARAGQHLVALLLLGGSQSYAQPVGARHMSEKSDEIDMVR